LRHAGERTIATFSLPIILWIHSDYENALNKISNKNGRDGGRARGLQYNELVVRYRRSTNATTVNVSALSPLLAIVKTGDRDCVAPQRPP